MNKNLLTTLEASRPADTIDGVWPKQLQLAERTRIMATSHPASIATTPRRRVGAMVLVGSIFAVSGVGIAAAAGLMPKAFTDAYSHWHNGPAISAVDPATAVRVASIPGPDGTVLSVFVAHGPQDMRCVAAVFESAADTNQPGPSDFTGLGDYCHPGTDHGAFGDGAGLFADPNGFIYDAAAGTAVRAELHTATGEILPTVLVEGRFFGWGPLPAGAARPTLVGYAADGTVVGSR